MVSSLFSPCCDKTRTGQTALTPRRGRCWAVGKLLDTAWGVKVGKRGLRCGETEAGLGVPRPVTRPGSQTLDIQAPRESQRSRSREQEFLLCEEHGTRSKPGVRQGAGGPLSLWCVPI